MAESNSHVGNGLIGGQWLMRTLTNTGHADVAYTIASQKSYPSWGYMVEQGATTIWELWNGDHGDPAMNSGNHVMLLGDLIIWFYENLAGIRTDPDIPAFKHIVMKPYVLGDLAYVNASYNSIYGEIKSGWKLEKNKFKWDISIPANTSATIYVPTLNKEDVMEGNKLSSASEGIKFIGWENNLAVFQIESGQYSFTSKGVKKSITKRYVIAPVITPKDNVFMDGEKVLAEITCKDKEAIIHYSIDGSEPNESSPVYTKPLDISNQTLIRARSYRNGYNPSTQSKKVFNFVDPSKNGIRWNLYEGEFNKLPNFDELNSTANGVVFQFGLNKIDVPKNNFALQFISFIEIDKEGKYEFSTSSNDGSKLFIDDELIVDNDGEHGAKEISGLLNLTIGLHEIRIEYFQSGGSKALFVNYSSDEIKFQPIPGSKLFKNKN